MIVELVHAANYRLNMFPANDRHHIMMGQWWDYNQLQFGQYAHVHESHNNSMSSRTTGAIALRPTGNAQGGYYILSCQLGNASIDLPCRGSDQLGTLVQHNLACGDILFGWWDATEILDVDTDADDIHTNKSHNDNYFECLADDDEAPLSTQYVASKQTSSVFRSRRGW